MAFEDDNMKSYDEPIPPIDTSRIGKIFNRFMLELQLFITINFPSIMQSSMLISLILTWHFKYWFVIL